MAGSSSRDMDSREDIELRTTSGKKHSEASSPISSEHGIDYATGQWVNSDADRRDMMRMGKQQEFKRNFNLLSALGFVSVYMATWEFVLVSLAVGFNNGGFGGLFWCFITTTLCYSTVVASLAEMESMAPTAGGEFDEHPRGNA
jgi:amino acid permease